MQTSTQYITSIPADSSLLQTLLSYEQDGIIVSGLPAVGRLERLCRNDIPIVQGKLLVRGSIDEGFECLIVVPAKADEDDDEEELERHIPVYIDTIKPVKKADKNKDVVSFTMPELLFMQELFVSQVPPWQRRAFVNHAVETLGSKAARDWFDKMNLSSIGVEILPE